MKIYAGLVSLFLLVACGQEKPPGLDKTDPVALKEFQKEYTSTKFVSYSLLSKERTSAEKVKGDDDIFNIGYKFQIEQNYDFNAHVMHEALKNQKIIDPDGIFEIAVAADTAVKPEDTFLDTVGKFLTSTVKVAQTLDFHMSINPPPGAKNILDATGQNISWLQSQPDILKTLNQCGPCDTYIDNSNDTKDLKIIKLAAFGKAVRDLYEKGNFKVNGTTTFEKEIRFQVQKS